MCFTIEKHGEDKISDTSDEMEAGSFFYEDYIDEKEREEGIDRIWHDLYANYGSGTGVLFGIPANLKSSVRAIVKVILEMKQR